MSLQWSDGAPAAPSYMFFRCRISNGFLASVVLPHIQDVRLRFPERNIDFALPFSRLSLDLCRGYLKSTEWGTLVLSTAILFSGHYWRKDVTVPTETRQ